MGLVGTKLSTVLLLGRPLEFAGPGRTVQSKDGEPEQSSSHQDSRNTEEATRGCCIGVSSLVSVFFLQQERRKGSPSGFPAASLDWRALGNRFKEQSFQKKERSNLCGAQVKLMHSRPSSVQSSSTTQAWRIGVIDMGLQLTPS